MNYLEAKAAKARLEEQCAACSVALKQFPTAGPFGLTPDEVKRSAEYQAAKRGYDQAFQQLRAFNSRYVQAFKADIAADRRRA